MRTLRDLAGRTVAVTAGKTSEVAVRSLAERQGLGIRFVTAPDHAQSQALLASGQADGFASDDMPLFGWIAGVPDGRSYRVTGDYLSHEPYSPVYRRDDPAFAAVVKRSFARMARERRLRDLYTRWFLRRRFNGQRLDQPMSRQLEEIIRVLGSRTDRPPGVRIGSAVGWPACGPAGGRRRDWPRADVRRRAAAGADPAR